MIRQLAHVCLHTTNLESMVDFYTEGLGLPVQFRLRNDEEFRQWLAEGETNPGPKVVRGSNNGVLVEAMGLEPTTSCLQSRCSSQLSYAPEGSAKPTTTMGRP